MKQYKENDNNNLLLTKYSNCYAINTYYHGFYYFIFNNTVTNKGYFNMDEEYGHWLDGFNDYYYYL